MSNKIEFVVALEPSEVLDRLKNEIESNKLGKGYYDGLRFAGAFRGKVDENGFKFEEVDSGRSGVSLEGRIEKVSNGACIRGVIVPSFNMRLVFYIGSLVLLFAGALTFSATGEHLAKRNSAILFLIYGAIFIFLGYLKRRDVHPMKEKITNLFRDELLK